jgi:hypothetical protein
MVRPRSAGPDEVGHLFLARERVRGAPEPGGAEEIAVRCLPVESAIAMEADRRITDAIRIVGVFQLARWLERRWIRARVAQPEADEEARACVKRCSLAGAGSGD